MTMDRSARVDRALPALFDQLAEARTPDYLEAAIERASSRPQRPAWTFAGRWLPVELTTTRVPATRMPMRQLGVLALIAILVAAALAVYVGSHQQKLPAPFGPAENGSVVYADGGDIYAADPESGVTKPIVSGGGFALRPRFSHDGTRIAFERRASPSDRLGNVYVADPDGSDLTRLTPQSVLITASYLGESWEPYEFSPDGRTLLIAASGGMLIAQTDGSGVKSITLNGLPRSLNVTEPSFSPPDGHEILFVGKEPAAWGAGLYVLDRATGDVRTLVEPRSGTDLAGPEWSPDGSRIAYWTWTDDPSTLTPRTHVVLADGTDDRELPMPPDVPWNAGSAWSNDGSRLLIIQGHATDYTDSRMAVAPADGSAVATEIDIDGPISSECCLTWEWAPDDSWIIIRPVDSQGAGGQQIFVDPVAGTSRVTSWNTTGEPTVQRVAR
ncbi:MAG TPA: hypothetical protein VFN41_01660 [Candidatus Limnocylindrales bacterium]|nr:hypothetical protein [Candidatus Limnocylindrales bacterium]